MKPKHFLILIISVVLLFNCRKMDVEKAMHTQINKLYGGSSDEGAYEVIDGQKGGYVFAGWTFSIDGDVSGNKGSMDAWIVKLKNNGVIDWQKTFGGSGVDGASSIISSGDGGYVFAGKSTSSDGDLKQNYGQGDAWIVKLDEGGNILWQKIIGGSNDDEAASISATLDGGYVVLILVDANIISDHHSMIVKIDKNGNELWRSVLDNGTLKHGFKIMATSNGQFVVIGEDRDQNGLADGGIVKLDQNGGLLWQRQYSGLGNDVFSGVTNSSDGGYMLVGITSAISSGDNDGWIVKLDKDGLMQWQKTLGTSRDDAPRAIIRSLDGQYIVAGNTLSDIGGGNVKTGNDNGWLFKMDESGNILWQKSYGGGFGDAFSSVTETRTGGYLIAGASQSNDGDVSGNHGSLDAWIITVKR